MYIFQYVYWNKLPQLNVTVLLNSGCGGTQPENCGGFSVFLKLFIFVDRTAVFFLIFMFLTSISLLVGGFS